MGTSAILYLRASLFALVLIRYVTRMVVPVYLFPKSSILRHARYRDGAQLL